MEKIAIFQESFHHVLDCLKKKMRTNLWFLVFDTGMWVRLVSSKRKALYQHFSIFTDLAQEYNAVISSVHVQCIWALEEVHFLLWELFVSV